VQLDFVLVVAAWRVSIAYKARMGTIWLTSARLSSSIESLRGDPMDCNDVVGDIVSIRDVNSGLPPCSSGSCGMICLLGGVGDIDWLEAPEYDIVRPSRKLVSSKGSIKSGSRSFFSSAEMLEVSWS
jgi:hypothetical protein